jgi:molybdate transport system substrate-binding protein
VSLGEADAGFVYVTDVKPVEGKVEVIELPDSAQAKVEYPIAVVKGTEHEEAARDYVELVLGPEGQQALADAGFGPP